MTVEESKKKISDYSNCFTDPDSREEAQKVANEYKMKLSGKLFRHFKGGIYYVETVAVHSETAEPMVIYKTLEKVPGGLMNTRDIWARPLSMFLSEVDHEKYPDVKQKMRFEYIDPTVNNNITGISAELR